MTFTTQEENYVSDNNQVSIPKFLRGLAVHNCGCSCNCQIYDGKIGRRHVSVVKKRHSDGIRWDVGASAFSDGVSFYDDTFGKNDQQQGFKNFIDYLNGAAVR